MGKSKSYVNDSMKMCTWSLLINDNNYTHSFSLLVLHLYIQHYRARGVCYPMEYFHKLNPIKVKPYVR